MHHVLSVRFDDTASQDPRPVTEAALLRPLVTRCSPPPPGLHSLHRPGFLKHDFFFPSPSFPPLSLSIAPSLADTLATWSAHVENGGARFGLMKQVEGLGPETLGHGCRMQDTGWVVELFAYPCRALHGHLTTLRLRSTGYHVSSGDECCHVNCGLSVHTRQTLR